MSKKTLSPEQKRLDTDIWIIALVTLAVFCLYARVFDTCFFIHL